MKKIISIAIVFSMVFGVCIGAKAAVLGINAEISGKKITFMSSKSANQEATEKYGKDEAITYLVTSFDSEGKLVGCTKTDTKISNYLSFGKDTGADLTKIAIADNAVKAKVFAWSEEYEKPNYTNMPENITLHIIGASTTTNAYGESSYPQQGWGYQFERFFNVNVVVSNVAKGGWSLKSLQEVSANDESVIAPEQSVYAQMMKDVKAGDFVIIGETGLNERYQTKGDKYDDAGNLIYTWMQSPEEYKERLEKTIREIKAKGATPIVMIDMGNHTSNAFAYPESTETDYAAVQRELCDEMGVTLINHRAAFYGYLKSLGFNYKDFQNYCIMTKDAKQWYCKNDHVGSGVNMEKDDNVHYTTTGALILGDSIIKELKKSDSKLVYYLKD